jgi:hypothetical protein
MARFGQFYASEGLIASMPVLHQHEALCYALPQYSFGSEGHGSARLARSNDSNTVAEVEGRRGLQRRSDRPVGINHAEGSGDQVHNGGSMLYTSVGVHGQADLFGDL